MFKHGLSCQGFQKGFFANDNVTEPDEILLPVVNRISPGLLDIITVQQSQRYGDSEIGRFKPGYSQIFRHMDNTTVSLRAIMYYSNPWGDS